VKNIALVCVYSLCLQSYRDSNIGDTWWAENLGIHSETVLCFLVRVMQVGWMMYKAVKQDSFVHGFV